MCAENNRTPIVHGAVYLELRQYPVEYYTTCEYTCKFFTLDPRTMVGQKSQISMLIALRKPEHAKTDPNLGQYTCIVRSLVSGTNLGLKVIQTSKLVYASL